MYTFVHEEKAITKIKIFAICSFTELKFSKCIATSSSDRKENNRHEKEFLLIHYFFSNTM